MKLFKSIKWRLQLWYGLILVVVLAGFGTTAYVLESSRQFRKLDEELHNRIGVIGNSLRRQQPRGPNGNRPPRRQNPDEPPFDGPQPGQFPSDDPQGRNARPPARFALLPEDVHFFEAAEPFGYYFRIQTRDGFELACSTNAPDADNVAYENGPLVKINQPPDVAKPAVAGYDGEVKPDVAGDAQKIPLGRVGRAWMRGSFREVQVETPAGDTILVGKNISPELKDLRLVAYTLSGVGVGILLLGLTGGWWLVSRSLRPVANISAAALKISAGDLSQRIDVAEAESELGQLAMVLNSTFARLETAFAQQKQFASDAAHELRTPVSVILTQTQTALNRERDAASYKQTVEACQRAAQRMRKLIESLLALARFDAGQEVLQRQRFDLSKTISDCAELVQPLAEERGVKIFVETEALEITGDSGRLAQVVTNLLTNAIQYNRSEGEVRVTLDSQNGLAVLAVVDTGQGIAAENLPSVFGRFFRADQSRTGAGNAGLGLAITKAIIEAHGGTIEVTSTENDGTTFTVRLPI
jgi:heavy metal sensor kinase